jgi:hypothetical protein
MHELRSHVALTIATANVARMPMPVKHNDAGDGHAAILKSSIF